MDTLESTKLSDANSTKTGGITVLVEEEARIRHLWSDYYRKNGWELEVFENPFDFLRQIDRFRQREEKIYFFFDQDFGRVRGVGVELARAVRGLNQRQRVSLITRYIPEMFQKELREGLLQCVFDKYPEFIFGENYDVEQFGQNPDLWKIKERDWNDPNPIELELGSCGADFDFTLEKHFPSLAPKPAPIIKIVESVPPPKLSKPVKTPWWRRLVLSPAYSS